MSIETLGQGTAGFQAAARLEGLDVCKVFDLDNTGTIHQVVLARSLHIFDQSVFTPPVVQELVDILASMVPDRTDGRVPVQTLVDLMAQPEIGPEAVRRNRRLKRRPTLTEQICEALEIFTDSLVSGIRGFREVVSPASINASALPKEEIERWRGPLRSKAQKHVLEVLRQSVCPLWDEFDKAGSGLLAPSEVPPLVAAYLRILAVKSNEVIRTSLEMASELSIMVAMQIVKDKATKKQIHAHAKLQVDAIHASVAPKTQEMLDMMAAEEPQTIAGELLAEMLGRLDPSGKVPREVFELTFVESMQYVLGPGPFVMDKLQRINSLP